jgi:hypothetical protein
VRRELHTREVGARCGEEGGALRESVLLIH